MTLPAGPERQDTAFEPLEAPPLCFEQSMEAPAPAISAAEAPGQDDSCGAEEHSLVPASRLVRHLSQVSQKQLSADIVRGVVEGLPLAPSSVSDVGAPLMTLDRVPGDSRAVAVTVVHRFRAHFDEALPASPTGSAAQPPLLLTAAARSSSSSAGGCDSSSGSGSSGSGSSGSGSSGGLRVEELPMHHEGSSSESMGLAAANIDILPQPGPASEQSAGTATALRALMCRVEVPDSPHASSRGSGSGGSGPPSGGSGPPGSLPGAGLASIPAGAAAERAGSGSAPASAPTPSAGEPSLRMGSTPTPELSSGSSSAAAGAAATGGSSGGMQQQHAQQQQVQQQHAQQQQVQQQHGAMQQPQQQEQERQQQAEQQHRRVEQQEQQMQAAAPHQQLHQQQEQQRRQEQQRARMEEPLLLQPPAVWEPAAVARDVVALRFSQDQEWAQQMQRRRSPMLRQDSLMPFEVNPHDILVGDRLAVGGFAEVFVGRYQGTAVAIKLLLSVDERGQESFRQEVHVLERLRHPNIVLFMGVCTRPYLAILSEYMARGSLFKLLRRGGNRPLPRKLQRSVAVSVARGMSYLHSRSPPLLHLDLKSPNILLDERWRVKIADFGLSRLKSSACMSTGAGTPEWMAPEILRSESYDERADVYSYGVVLHECLTGQQPWQGLHPMQVVGAVGFQGKQLPTDGMEGEDFIVALCLRCLSSEPRLRPTFPEILRDLEHHLAPRASGSNRPGSQLLAEGGIALDAAAAGTAAGPAAAVVAAASPPTVAAASTRTAHAVPPAAPVHGLPALPPLVPPHPALRLPVGIVRPGGAGVPGVGMIGAPQSPRDGEEPLSERPYGGHDPSPFAPSSTGQDLPVQPALVAAPLEALPAAADAPRPAAPEQPSAPSPFASPFGAQQSPFDAPPPQQQQPEGQPADRLAHAMAADVLPAVGPDASAAAATAQVPLALHPAFSITNDSPFAQLPAFDEYPDDEEEEGEEEWRTRGASSRTPALKAISEGSSQAASGSSSGSGSLGQHQPTGGASDTPAGQADVAPRPGGASEAPAGTADVAADVAPGRHMCQLSSFSRSHNSSGSSSSSSGDLPEGGSRLSSGSLVREPSLPFVTLADAVAGRPGGSTDAGGRPSLAKQRSAAVDGETPLPCGAAAAADSLAGHARSPSQGGGDPTHDPLGTQPSHLTMTTLFNPPSFASIASITEPDVWRSLDHSGL